MAKRTTIATWLEKYNRWQIKVQKDGIRKTFTSSTPGKKGQRECHDKADKWLDCNIDGSIKLGILYDKWIEELKLTTGKDHYTQYYRYGENWIKPVIKNVKAENITEQHLQNIINNAFKKGLAKKTLTNIKGCIMAFLKYCRKNNATTLFPENLYISKQAYEKERVILQPNDIVKLFKNDNTICRNKEKYEPFINAYRFEVATGLRPGEVIGLQWSDIKGDQVYIKRSINRYEIETKGKNLNAQRKFILTEIAKNIINKQKEYSKKSDIKSMFVFPDQYGDNIFPQLYYRHWVRYRDYHKLSKASPYELRHTFVSIIKSLPEGYLKQLVGHSKDMDSYGVYSHEVNGDMLNAAKEIEKIFKKII
jgi:integrase